MNGMPALNPRIINIMALKFLYFGVLRLGSIVMMKQIVHEEVIIAIKIFL